MLSLADLRHVVVAVALAATVPARVVAAGFGADDASMTTALATVTWEGAGPMGDLKSTKIVDSVSPLGAAGDLRLLLGRHTSLGVSLAWNQFRGDNDATIETIAPRLVAHWYLSSSRVQPYLGVGVGAVWTSTKVGTTPAKHVWGGCADPQLGLLVTVSQELALDFHVRYSLTTVSVGDVRDYQWLAVGAGFGFY